MSRDLDSILAEVVERAATAARPAGAAAARRRGRRRTIAQTAVAGATAMAAAGAATALVLSFEPAPGGHGSTVVVTTPNTSASGSTPTAGASAPSATPSAGHSPTATGGKGTSVALSLPTAFAAGTPTPFSYTVVNRGAARTARITVDLGSPTANTPTSGPNQTAELERRAADGSWQPVAVSYDPARGHDLAHYGLALPGGGSATERLRLIPVGVNATTVRVEVAGGGSASATVPIKAPTVTGTGPAAASPGGTPEFDFTVTDPTSAAYPSVRLYLDAYGSTPNCATSVFPKASWSDGGSWSTASFGSAAAGSGWPLLGTVSLAPGGSVHLRVRLPIPSSPPSCLARAQVSVIAQTPGATGSLSGDHSGANPGFTTRGDAPFFAIG